ncbi:MAG: DUF1240 domain-containing protein [Morganella sp. (in: enterobacteria)]
MDEIKPVKMYFASAILLFFVALGAYGSIASYIEYFLKGDTVSFSFQVGVIIFGVPFLARGSYFLFICGYRRSKQKANNKINNVCIAIMIIGIIFSFIFSFYVAYDLNSKGYVTCPKKSMLAPTEYVISKDMCE